MVANAELADYLAEMRAQVCSRCVERPPGGPPGAPLGKFCGVEMHLPQLIDSIHQVRSDSIAPYLEHNRHAICSKCPFLHGSICPCPMEYLAVLVVEAVEAVDQRRARPVAGGVGRCAPPEGGPGSVEDVRRAFQEAVGSWTGCDWPTRFGAPGLDLNCLRSASAAAMASAAATPEEGRDWHAAACWLASVERNAAQAEIEAALAVTAAEAGDWAGAGEHAGRAWALEFATGRPLWHPFPGVWLPLRQAVERAAQARAGVTAG